MWPDSVVVNAPAFGQHTQFFHRVENLSVQKLIPQLRIGAFAIAVLPGRAGFDMQRFCACGSQPLAQILGRKLRAVVGAKMLRNALHHYPVCQRTDHPSARPTPLASNQQALARGFVDQIQPPHRAPVMRLGTHEVVTPHMVLALRLQPRARSIVKPQAASCVLLLWNLQPFATPNSFDSIRANLPARSLVTAPLQEST